LPHRRHDRRINSRNHPYEAATCAISRFDDTSRCSALESIRFTVESQAAHLLLRTVAAETALLQQRFDITRKIDFGGDGRRKSGIVSSHKTSARSHDHRGQQVDPQHGHIRPHGRNGNKQIAMPCIQPGAFGVASAAQNGQKTHHGIGGWENTHTLKADAPFFSTMKIQLIAGRSLDERDRAGSAPVAIVNGAWVKANLAGGNAVGQRVVSFGMDDKPVEMEVIGVAKNALYNRIEENFPATVYLSLDQNLGAQVEEMTFFLRTSGDPLKYAGAVREIVHETDARIPVTNLASQEQRTEEHIGDEILFARLSSGFGLLALSIASVGLYGTMSYTVARRTGEIGIRMALGAGRPRVVWMIMRQVAILSAVGLAIGLPMAFGASRLVESLLYGVKAGDLASIVTAVVTMVIAVIAAGYAPARRASRVDPLVALRHE
jgi:hypothetical protein